MIDEDRETGVTPSGAELPSQPSSDLIEASTNPRSASEPEQTSRGENRSHPAPLWRSTRVPVLTIGFLDEHSFTRECITRLLKELGSLEIIPFASSNDCLQNQHSLDLIVYNYHEIATDNIDAQKDFIRKLVDVAPVIVLSTVDRPEAIFSAIESGARGYIPTVSTTPELAIEIIRLVRAGGTFVPPSSLSMRSANRAGGPRAAATEQFTPRQVAVLEHLKRGKANKTIAHELDMSESTVKVHIRNIMKKMNATNRTEAACRAHQFAVGQEPE